MHVSLKISLKKQNLPLFLLAFFCLSKRQVLQQRSDGLRKDISCWPFTSEADIAEFFLEGSAVVF